VFNCYIIFKIINLLNFKYNFRRKNTFVLGDLYKLLIHRKIMRQLQIRFALILTVMLLTVIKALSQNTMPDVFQKNSLKEQLNYLEEHTKIYDNFRAIREDMFQKVKENISDTLSSANSKVRKLNNTKVSLNTRIDTLKATIEKVTVRLDEMSKTKNSISVLGIEVNKQAYNKVMWILVAILIALLAVGFLIFKRNLSAMANTNAEYQDLRKEFEAYRKTSREAREKLTMDHFNEIKRIKEGR